MPTAASASASADTLLKPRVIQFTDEGLHREVLAGFKTGDFPGKFDGRDRADYFERYFYPKGRAVHDHYYPLTFFSDSETIVNVVEEISNIADFKAYYSSEEKKQKDLDSIEKELSKFFPRDKHTDVREIDIERYIERVNQIFAESDREKFYLKRDGDKVIFFDITGNDKSAGSIFVREADGSFKKLTRSFLKLVEGEDPKVPEGTLDNEIFTDEGKKYVRQTVIVDSETKTTTTNKFYEVVQKASLELATNTQTFEESFEFSEDLTTGKGEKSPIYSHSLYLYDSTLKTKDGREDLDELRKLRTHNGRPIFDLVEAVKVGEDVGVRVEFKSAHKNPKLASRQLYHFVQTSNGAEKHRDQKHYRDEEKRLGGSIFGKLYAPGILAAPVGWALSYVGFAAAKIADWVPGLVVPTIISDAANASATACYDLSAKGAQALGKQGWVDDIIEAKTVVRKNASLPHRFTEPLDKTSLFNNRVVRAPRNIVSFAIGAISTIGALGSGAVSYATNSMADAAMLASSKIWAHSKKMGRRKDIPSRAYAWTFGPISAGVFGVAGVVLRVAGTATDFMHTAASAPAEAKVNSEIPPEKRAAGSFFGSINRNFRNNVQNKRYFGKIEKPQPVASYKVSVPVTGEDGKKIDSKGIDATTMFSRLATLMKSPKMNKESDVGGDVDIDGDRTQYIKLSPKIEFGGKKYKVIVGPDGKFKVSEDFGWMSSIFGSRSQEGVFPSSLKGRKTAFLDKAKEEFSTQIITLGKASSGDIAKEGISLDDFVQSFVVPDFKKGGVEKPETNLNQIASDRIKKFLLDAEKNSWNVTKTKDDIGTRFVIGNLGSANYVVTIDDKDGRIGVAKERYLVDTKGVLPQVDFVTNEDGSVDVNRDLFSAINIAAKAVGSLYYRGSDELAKTTWKDYVSKLEASGSEPELESEPEQPVADRGISASQSASAHSRRRVVPVSNVSNVPSSSPQHPSGGPLRVVNPEHMPSF